MIGGGQTIYTLGTSTHSESEFIHLLKGSEIQIVVDVRRFPTSRFEYFKRETLTHLLRRAEIDYLYLGGKLGGYREGGYRTFIASAEFKQGLAELEKVATQKRAAIICAERLPWRCHRRFIAGKLEERGWQVNHIIDEKRTWEAKKII